MALRPLPRTPAPTQDAQKFFLTVHYLIETLPADGKKELLRILCGRGRPGKGAQGHIVDAMSRLLSALQEIDRELQEDRDLARATLGLLLRRYRIRVLGNRRKDEEID